MKLTIHCYIMKLIKENGIDLMSIPPARLKEYEQVNFEAVTTAVKKAVRLHRAIQAKDGHWPAENAAPMFFTPPLVSENCSMKIRLLVSCFISCILEVCPPKNAIDFKNYVNQL